MLTSQPQPTCKIAESDTPKRPFVRQKQHHPTMPILDLPHPFASSTAYPPTSSGTPTPDLAPLTDFQVFSPNSAS